MSLISSKNLLEKTGVSRATLNNYIKMGILPRPIVLSVDKGKVRKIGYFPREAVQRVEIVKILKREGHPMQAIAERFKSVPLSMPRDYESGVRRFDTVAEIRNEEPELTLKGISSPAYLLTYSFEIKWINLEAETRLFGHQVSLIQDLQTRNIFRVLFNREFHNNVKNWKDLLGFHMSFAKSILSERWLDHLLRGFSETEYKILKKVYDEVPAFSGQTPKLTNINISLTDRTTQPYNVHTMFFKEGILFIYVAEGSERRSLKPGIFIRSGMNIPSVRDGRAISSSLRAQGKGPVEDKESRGQAEEGGGGENGLK